MGESSNNHHNLPNPSSRFGLRSSGAGEIVEVQGGHIVRSTGRKDRHSKVCTAKGPRDRRMRLAAHTAIQFYDVQDRLGYDRPSKAVDWLIKKAKDAIDELEQLPTWNPIAGSAQVEEQQQISTHHQAQIITSGSIPAHQADTFAQNASFLPPSMDSSAIADANKSFFPMGAASSSDLRLSLQSFHYPILHHTEQVLSGTPIGFDGTATWPEQHHHQRLAAWNSGGDTGGSGYLFNSAPAQQHQFFQQRGPLQSSNTPSIHAWMDPSTMAMDPSVVPFYPSSVPGIGFSGGFSGFQIPARIQGEEEHDGYSGKPSSASSDSRH